MLDKSEALRDFYETSFPRVYAYFFQRCGGVASVAEDLTQETFLAAAREINKGTVPSAPHAWVLGIARHHLLDHYRDKQREERKLSLAYEKEPSSAPRGVLHSARRGDPEAFVTLLETYDRSLRALAYRLLRDSNRMEDALQEAYLRAYRGLPSFRGKAALATWLYRIVYNACLDELGRATAAAGSLEDASEQADPRPGPAEVAAESRDLESALASLPSEERAAVLLVDAEGFSYEEAAEVLGIPMGTLASRLHRARRALRQALAEEVI